MKALLIAWLLSSSAPVPDVFFPIAPDIAQQAIKLEILDPREVRYVLTRKEDFESDMKLLRRRLQELKDAPPLGQQYIFPDRSAISDMLAFNRAYRQNLDARLSVELVRAWEIQEAIQETDKIYVIWDLARDAKCDYYYVTVRRQALKRLRDMVGPYYDMPPYVPLWRFNRID